MSASLPLSTRSTRTQSPFRHHRGGAIGFGISLAATLLSTGLILFADLPNQMLGVLVIVLGIALTLVGVPVGMAMLGSALIGLWAIGGSRVVTSTMQQAAFGSADSWSYSVIPLFVLMGTLLWKSGLTASAFEAARQWLGNVPGGLAVATNFAGAGLAAGSGSTIGITFALGRVAIPEMMRAGYRPSLAVGTVAAAGALGQIIPPSLLLVIYAGAASVPAGPQLLAGIVPGIILAVMFAIMIAARAAASPSLAPRADLRDVTWATRVRSLGGIVPIAAVVVLVVGGLLFGFFTATESAAIGAVAALAFGTVNVLTRQRSWRAVGRMVKDSIVPTLASTGSIFLLILGIEVLTRTLALSQVASSLAQLIVDLGLGRVELLLLLIVFYLVLGMFMDELAMMLLTIPILIGPVQEVGVDPIWFGVFLVLMAEIGMLMPPLGILPFIVHRIASDRAVNLGTDIPLTTVFKGVIWFAATALVLVLLIIFVPDLVTWLPEMSAAR